MLNDSEMMEMATEHQLIEPFDIELLNPHSYDCTLHPYIIRQTRNGDWVHEPIAEDTFVFPNEFLLASTNEFFKMPQSLVGFVQGKSSVGRKGLQVENAGLIDAGFSGQITLELYNMSKQSVRLFVDMPICQVYFVSVQSPVIKDYSKTGHYNGQKGPTLSKMS